MKDRFGFFFGLIILLLLSCEVFAQYNAYFKPNPDTLILAPKSSQILILKTEFFGDATTYPDVKFVGTQGFFIVPNEVSNYGPGGVNLEIFDTLDHAGCANPVGISVLAGGNGIACYCFAQYVYDPKIIGRAYIFYGDSLNFGSQPVGTDNGGPYPYVDIDSVGSAFRKLHPLNVRPPFSCADSITPTFGTCSIVPSDPNRFHFLPTEAKHYVDTTFLFDPLADDSTMLILLGEGVAASVPENPAASELRIYPNPADREATVALGAGEMQMVTIYNVMGMR